MSDDDDEDSISDHSSYSNDEAQEQALFRRSSWCTEKPMHKRGSFGDDKSRRTAQDPSMKKLQSSIYSDLNPRYSSKFNEYLPLVENNVEAAAAESCAGEHKQKARVLQKRNTTALCSPGELLTTREADQVVRDVRGLIKSEKAEEEEEEEEEEEKEASGAAEFEKFKNDVSGNNSMRGAVRFFNYATASLEVSSQDAVRRAFEKAQHECMLAAWKGIQQREHNVRNRIRLCAIADEKFRTKTAEAEDQRRHCVHMQTKYLKEISQLRDQLNHKRSEKLKEMNIDIDKWQPLLDLDEDAQALVVTCTVEQLKSSLTSESGLCGLIEAKVAAAQRTLKSEMAVVEEALAHSQNKTIEQAVEISKLRDRWNTRRRKSILSSNSNLNIGELSNSRNHRPSECSDRHWEGNCRLSEGESNRRLSMQVDETKFETQMWLPLQDLAAEIRDLVVACTDEQLKSDMTDAGLAELLESKVAAAKQTLESKVVAAEDAIVHAQKQRHGQAVEITHLTEELEQLREELEKQKNELDKQKEELDKQKEKLDKQKEAVDNHKDKPDLKTDLLSHKSNIEVSCAVCGTPVAVPQDLISESRKPEITGTVTKPTGIQPKSQTLCPRKKIRKSGSPDSNYSGSNSNEQLGSAEEESCNPSDSFAGSSGRAIDDPVYSSLRSEAEEHPRGSPLQQASGGKRGSDTEAKTRGFLPMSHPNAGQSHNHFGKAKFLVGNSGAIKQTGSKEANSKPCAVLPSVFHSATPIMNSKIEELTTLTVEAPEAAMKTKKITKPNCPMSSGHSGVGWRKSSTTSDNFDGMDQRKTSKNSVTSEVSGVGAFPASRSSRANSLDSQVGDAMIAQSMPTAPAARKPAESGKLFHLLRGQNK